MAGAIKRDVYVANIGEAGPGQAAVTFRDAPDEKAEGGAEGAAPRATMPGNRDFSMVFPAKDVPTWGAKYTLELRERK